MAFLTLSEYKTMKGITGTAQDAIITIYLETVQSDIEGFCNTDFNAWEDFPASLKTVARDMVSIQLAGNNGGKKSESIDGYSYTMEDVGKSGYPVSIEAKLAVYRLVKFANIQAQTVYRDSRGMSNEDIADGKEWNTYPGLPL
jgi:hypothetical protein